MVAGQSTDDAENQDSDNELDIFGLYATNCGTESKGYHVEVVVNSEHIV